MSRETLDGRSTDYNEVDFSWIPIGDWVFVKPDPPDMVRNGIILAPEAQEDKRTGVVMSVGKGRWNPFLGQFEPVEVKSGDLVLFGEYSGTDIFVSGEKYKHMKITEIVAFKAMKGE